MSDTTLLEILWHSLGMNKSNYRRGLPWWNDNDKHRNHFAADPQGTDAKDIAVLMELGLMFRGHPIPGGLAYYHVTRDGVGLAKSQYGAKIKRMKEGVA